MEKIKKLRWVGSSLKDLKSLPLEVQDEVGYALYQAQVGDYPYHAKPLI